jgi:hypothetical protein
VVEQAFGKLKMRWCICHHNNTWSEPDMVAKAIRACCCLQNFLQAERDADSMDAAAIDEALASRLACPEGIPGAAEGVRNFLAQYMLEVYQKQNGIL